MTETKLSTEPPPVDPILLDLQGEASGVLDVITTLFPVCDHWTAYSVGPLG